VRTHRGDDTGYPDAGVLLRPHWPTDNDGDLADRAAIATAFIFSGDGIFIAINARDVSSAIHFSITRIKQSPIHFL
jgi:hypothetical protein